MTPAGDPHRIRGATAAAGLRGTLLRPGGLAHGVGKRFQIVTAGPGRSGAVEKADDLPAAWGGEALGVLGAQVVAVGFGVGGERAEDRGRVGVDVRQRRDGGTAASGSRTATYRAHDVGRYRTLERAATTLLQVAPLCRTVKRPTQPFGRTALTCADTAFRGVGRFRARSPLDTNHVNYLEIDGRVEIRNRAQPWLEWSTTAMPGGTDGCRRDAAWGSGTRAWRGLRFTSDGQPRNTPCRRT